MRQLPPDSALARSMDPDWQWTLEAQLLAAIADELAVLNRNYVAAHTERGKRPPPMPKRIPRPGVKDDRERYGKGAMPVEQMKAIQEKWARGELALVT